MVVSKEYSLLKATVGIKVIKPPERNVNGNKAQEHSSWVAFLFNFLYYKYPTYPWSTEFWRS
jgi:hypothetical protein